MSPIKILLVDDMPTNLRILKRLFERVDEACEIRTYSDPVRAIEAAAQDAPDLILCDYSMPKIRGDQFVSMLRANPKCALCLIVVVTVYDDDEFRRAAFEAGANEFLVSPVNFDEIRIRLRNWLRICRIQRGATAVPADLKDLVALLVDYAVASPEDSRIEFAKIHAAISKKLNHGDNLSGLIERQPVGPHEQTLLQA